MVMGKTRCLCRFLGLNQVKFVEKQTAPHRPVAVVRLRRGTILVVEGVWLLPFPTE
jgi:hypothetical protein